MDQPEEINNDNLGQGANNHEVKSTESLKVTPTESESEQNDNAESFWQFLVIHKKRIFLSTAIFALVILTIILFIKLFLHIYVEHDYNTLLNAVYLISFGILFFWWLLFLLDAYSDNPQYSKEFLYSAIVATVVIFLVVFLYNWYRTRIFITAIGALLLQIVAAPLVFTILTFLLTVGLLLFYKLLSWSNNRSSRTRCR